jgi:hypothetical protein
MTGHNTSVLPYLDETFLGRVKRSYRLAIDAAGGLSQSMWTAIGHMQLPIHRALMQDDDAGLRAIFADPGSTDLYFGVDNVCRAILAQFDAQPELPAGLPNVSADRIFRLAESLGIRRWLPPDGEQAQLYSGGHPQGENAERTLDEIERSLGFGVSFPKPFPREYGLWSSRGLATYRALQALYQTHRLLAEIKNCKNRGVLEIGPGMGRTAAYAFIAGLRDYSTIDLPMGVVGQACFLAKTIGPDSIWMLGDEESSAGDRIRLLPSSSLHSIRRTYGVVLNVDSITEMGMETASYYAAWIPEHAEIFLSINHEANDVTVADLATTHFAGASWRRFPYWMRHGYVEEAFTFSRT